MNKQKLIEKYEEKYETIFGFPVIRLNQILEDLKQLDEPQKPVIPQFVADWIKECKNDNFHLFGAMEGISSNQKKLDYWFREDDNIELFARAWLDGYEAEEEKRYLVKVMNIYSSSSMLKCDDITGEWFFGSEAQMFASSMIHTRKELEQAGFSWVFDSPGIEIEEVEGWKKLKY